MKRSRGLLMSLALSALVAGCGDSNPFIGKWQSDKDNFLCAGPGGTMTLELGPIACSFRRATQGS